jgi:hypothetical protein
MSEILEKRYSEKSEAFWKRLTLPVEEKGRYCSWWLLLVSESERLCHRALSPNSKAAITSGNGSLIRSVWNGEPNVGLQIQSKCEVLLGPCSNSNSRTVQRAPSPRKVSSHQIDVDDVWKPCWR